MQSPLSSWEPALPSTGLRGTSWCSAKGGPIPSHPPGDTGAQEQALRGPGTGGSAAAAPQPCSGTLLTEDQKQWPQQHAPGGEALSQGQ